jgi:hypothetical protein
MARHRHSRKANPAARRLTLEPLEPRAMFALAPFHVVIPGGGVIGTTLEPDGSVKIYGDDPRPFPHDVIVGDLQISPLVTGVIDATGTPKQWLMGDDGRLLSKTDVETDAAAAQRTIYKVSADGSWYVGLKRATAAGEQGRMVVWKAGADDLIPIGLSADQTGGPLIEDISNDGDVIYRAYVGEDLRYFAWDRTDGLLTLPSLYALEGNSSAGASHISLQAISADGQTIVGFSGGGSSEAPKMRATIWKNGVAHELPTPPGQTQSYALCVSDDGRIVGGAVGDGTNNHSSVWVDGVLQQLTFPLFTYDFGSVSYVVSGVGGDPNAWAALGWAAQWLATSDGIVHRLSSYLPEHYGLSLTGNTQPFGLLANDDALYIVATETPSSMCAGFNCTTSGKNAIHLLLLPTDDSRNELDDLDINGDHKITGADALLIINAINQNPSAALVNLPELRQAFPKIDVNGDGELTASDALRLIDFLNTAALVSTSTTLPSPSGEPSASDIAPDDDLSLLAADELFTQLASSRRARHP